MSKKGTKALASATLMSLVLTTALNAGPVKAAQGSVTRIGEADRYATAASVATKNWTTSDNVVLVSGEGYADAVSASALAKQLNAPILLTTAGSLNTDTANALSSLKAKNIYVVGGNASVSQSVRDQLKANYTLVELGGANRYETNAAVAQKLVDLGVKADNVIMVGGEGFSDALSVAPIAAAKGQILLLGMNDANYMKPVLDFVAKNNSKVTVVGTKNVISDAILSQVNGTRVDGGSDRWDTNLKVLAAFKDSVKMDKLYVASASYNAKDDGYADALVASALAGKSAAPLVLVDKDSADATNNAITYIKNNATKTTDVNVVGGTGVVSSTVVDNINKALGNPSTTVNTVQSIEAVSLNEIKIHFNAPIDSDSAEDVTSYKIDGTQLVPVDSATSQAKDPNAAVAKAVDDNTVVITLATARKQYDNVTVSVKKAISTKDKEDIIDAFDQSVEFKDLEAPTLKNVTVEGNSQLTIEFSETVNMKSIKDFASKVKIDGQSISNYSVDTTYSKVKNKLTKVDGYGNIYNGDWGFKVLFYLNSPLPTGNHTLKIEDGDSAGPLCDAAGFTFKEASQDFSVDSMTTQPEVKSIKETASGEVHITFDRPMDVQTAGNLGNYSLNGDSNTLSSLGLTTANNFDTDDNDCTIKLTGLSGHINTGSNTMYIKNNIKDAYGNKVADDTRKNFDDLKDETKPTVKKIDIIDSETIRVQFSKDVDYEYATNASNYKLVDSKNIDITNHIKPNVSDTDKGIYSYKGITDKSNTDTYTIKLQKYNPNNTSDDWRLTGGKYTLTIKNIIDTASTPNTMDDYTYTINGNDDVAPQGVGIYKKSNNTGSKDKVIVYFNEPMDTSTLTNKDNFKFINGENDTKSLPSDTNISVGGDNKSAILEFPSGYTVLTASRHITSGTSNQVTGVIASNVKDEAGNTLNGVAFSNNDTIDVPGATNTVKANTIRTYYDGDDYKVDVQFDRAIDQLTTADFTLGGVTPSNSSLNGDKVTLTFKDKDPATTADLAQLPGGVVTYGINKTSKVVDQNANPYKIDVVKALGQNARLAIKANNTTTDEAGASVVTLVDTTANSQNTIYDYQAAPKTTSDYWTGVTSANAGEIDLTFDTPLYSNSGIKTDDFTFSGSGTELKADSVSVVGKTVKFFFNKSLPSAVDVRAKSTASISTMKDADGNYANYVPSSDDIKKRTVTVTTGTPDTTGTTTNVDVTGVVLDNTTATLAVGGTKALVATVSPDNATNKTVTWTSSDNTVATVDATGKVTAVKAGTATITATAGTKSTTCTVTVTAGAIAPTLDVDNTTLLGFTFLKISYNGMKSTDTVSYDGTAATWSVKFNCFAVKFDGTKNVTDFDASKVSITQN